MSHHARLCLGLSAVLVAIDGLVSAAIAAPRTLVKFATPIKWEQSDVADAYDLARSNSCEPIPSGRPIEYTSFTPEKLDPRPDALPFPTLRRCMVSIGLDMTAADRDKLPTLSGSQITDYLDTHFVAISARICRDLDSSDLFLHHRPVGAMMSYRGPRITLEFDEFVQRCVQNIRSLGVVPTNDDQLNAKSWRTLVMLYKNALVSPTDETKTVDNYEYIFIRAREPSRGSSSKLDLHAFTTTHDRTRLVYFPTFRYPTRSSQCYAVGLINFTKYRFNNLLPDESVTRRVRYQAGKNYAIDDLNRRASEAGWDSFSDRLPEALDRIIDRDWPPAETLE